MDEQTMAKCFNEWMDRYTKDPAAFAREFECVVAHLRERGAGHEPSYGADCSAMMLRLKADLGL